MSLKAEEIPYLEGTKKPHLYVALERAADGDEFVTSASGKAVLLSRPEHLGEFWCPASLLRRKEAGETYGACVAVPMWFLKRENIRW